MSEISQIAPAPSCPAQPSGPCDFGPPRSFRDRSGRVGAVTLVRCVHCGLGVTRPPLADVAFLYEGRESQDYQPTTEGVARRIKQIAFRRDAKRLLGQVRNKPRRLLDYGCGSGLFTRCVGDLLVGGIVIGSDFHADPPAELKGRPYLSNAELEGSDRQFDTLLMMHVLEHDDDPETLLRRVARHAAPGARLVIEVPNIECAWAAVFGEAWDAWYMPFHRVHFSPQSLRAVIERSGLRVDREIDVCLPSMGRTLANILGTGNSLPFLAAGILLHPLQWLVERLTGRPSALRFIASKP